ncbi:FAD/NAD(P)-binding protein [Sphingobacterium paramultivorum]|uniref:FAD/NAD(P)-binding protein n=1 Tax=Sphingobacterium paramultivorum TaxID=2886510 RepID=A0A7G5DXE1_9SPHI|nr:FAD/NAD(P)-binding protein [Sphingobacterium paramultivorum]QMV66416.1 FAD/NAD(P)-binding protein [Sphingobacterium paramultivorum]WSO15210.1 FAD/NAD(P)-binding protein [Sphingobacterium paramultivorum]
MQQNIHVAIIGGGPSGLFMYKRLIENNIAGLKVSIFESRKQLGAGMPYSYEGATSEHLTNVSDHEIPELVSTIEDYVQSLSETTLRSYGIDVDDFNRYKVVPRLLLGRYLSEQFMLLKRMADEKGIETQIHLGSQVSDIIDLDSQMQVKIMVGSTDTYIVDKVIICTGHKWPTRYEGNVEHYFESPYPPSKLALKTNHAVGIRGASLTAIDAIRTLARHNGSFEVLETGELRYQIDPGSENFKLLMHTRSGLLPAIRFHQEEPFLANKLLISEEELMLNRLENEGFVSLDFLFDRNFKAQFKEKDPDFYAIVEKLSLEDFVEAVLSLREQKDAFEGFRQEHEQALKSIRRRQSIYWKEVLSALSFTLNYPAKYMSAEDMLRLKKVLMPLISIVIAFVPQSSSRELLALHDAGRLDVVNVGTDSRVEPASDRGANYFYTDESGIEVKTHYKTFVDCVGQRPLDFEEFTFKSLVDNGNVSPAYLRFRSVEQAKEQMLAGNDHMFVAPDGAIFLQVPGVKIDDSFRLVDHSGNASQRLFMMAVPYMGGYNPDYSGLDFCAATSEIIANRIASGG